MFDRFHLRFNFKSKVSRHHFKNKNECQLTSTFYSKILPQFWFTHYLRKTNILYDQNTILNCNKQKKHYQSSISILRSRMFLLMLKMVAQSIVSVSSPQRDTYIRASKCLQVQPIAKWLLIAFCLENTLSQIAIFDGMSISICLDVCCTKIIYVICNC